MIEVYCVEVSNLKEYKDIHKFFDYVPEKKREKLLKFKREEDRIRGLVGELLVRYIIVKKMGIKNKKINFLCNYYGKPYLEEIDGIKFNISHSGKYVICAISEEDVGIDIEEIGKIDSSILELVLCKEEEEEFLRAEDKNRFFYSIWTLKESFIKLIGKGLSIPLKSFAINGILSDEIYCIYKGEKFKFMQFNIDSKYKCSICFKDGNINKEIKIFNGSHFLKKTQELMESLV